MRWPDKEILERENTRLLLWASAAGLLSGIAAAAFRLAATSLPRLLWPANRDMVLAVAHSPLWARLFIPIAGSLLAGLVLMLGTRWSGPARGWDIMEAVVLRDGILHLRPTLVKCASSLLTVASAGAIGREGPMVLFAGTVASFAGRWLKAPTRHLRILVGCGIAAGIACAYNTPIGAALFTMEIIMGSFAIEIFAPLVFSSVLATIIARGVFGNLPVFQVPNLSMTSLWEIFPYLALGVLGGATAALFLQSLRTSSFLFQRSRLPRPLAMAVAGLALGITILWFPDVVGNGREAIRHLLDGEWSIPLALSLLGLRLALTSITVGSGAVGGVFTPTLFIGAVLGEALGSIFHLLFPAVVAFPKAYALVGMGALLAGTTHAPLTAVLMIFEMTLDYNLVLPLLLAAAASSLIARSLSSESVYTEAIRRKRDVGAEDNTVMTGLSVRDVMRSDQATVPANLLLPELLDQFISTHRNHLYVVDGSQRFLGVVSLQEAHRSLREGVNIGQVFALDLADTNFPTTTPEEPLDKVLERFWTQAAERLPVLDSRDSGLLIGTISQRDILGVYSLEVLHRRGLVARFQGEGTRERAATFIELPADHRIDDVPVPLAVIGTTVGQARFRDRYGLSVLLIRRLSEAGSEIRIIPDGGTELLSGDRLIVMGASEKLAAFRTGMARD